MQRERETSETPKGIGKTLETPDTGDWQHQNPGVFLKHTGTGDQFGHRDRCHQRYWRNFVTGIIYDIETLKRNSPGLSELPNIQKEEWLKPTYCRLPLLLGWRRFLLDWKPLLSSLFPCFYF